MIGIVWALVSGNITRALKWATANATRMLAIALALALAWGAWERSGKLSWKNAVKAQNLAIVAMQKEAVAKQLAVNARKVATNEAINKGSTDDNAKGLSAARTAVAAYARLHPVNRCPPRQASAGAVPDNSGLAAGASGETGMVAITVADLDALAAGTVRAESCRAWGQALVDSGLAEVGD